MVKRILLTLLLLLSIPCMCLAWQGKVVSVTEGDIINVLHDGKEEIIWLYGVDCPEEQQPYGMQAKEFTTGSVADQIVEVKPIFVDRSGAIIGIVYVNNQCLNEELIKAGLAWVSRKYAKGKKRVLWLRMEAEAKQAGIGLWSDPNPVPPWKFD